MIAEVTALFSAADAEPKCISRAGSERRTTRLCEVAFPEQLLEESAEVGCQVAVHLAGQPDVLVAPCRQLFADLLHEPTRPHHQRPHPAIRIWSETGRWRLLR